jgi:hypothetical protein
MADASTDALLNLNGRMFGVPYGSRTRVAAVKGRCPRPLDERDALWKSLRVSETVKLAERKITVKPRA